MTNVCFYFQVHQPYRLRKYPLFDIGKKKDSFDEKKNKEIMLKVARKCYKPANKVIQQLLNTHQDFKAAYSITGTALEQFEEYCPEVIDSFRELVATGKVELLNETYYHSLSSLFDPDEFKEQVKQHGKAMKREFGQRPKIFRNTELVYNNEIAKIVEKMGFKAILTEGWDAVLGWKSPNFVYKAKGAKIKLLMKNYKLSDDIAFRFGNKNWEGYPLTADKFASWVAPMLGDSINLFMDYETFGEHQWKDTGIFHFLKHLPAALKARNISFHTPSEVIEAKPKDEIDVPHTISWADLERDTSAWVGNKMQQSIAQQIFSIKHRVRKSKDKELKQSWNRLTTSDHLYYMCTKWFADGDVHKYFNPYESPYDCFINIQNVLQDMKTRLKRI
ncbi:glycoside hydrolase family 57 protein [Candidatus Woesearchaeota archaeon]|nr:glycoside hydrolase family 57 protein [Candidatus Woesearchaeota archaeon]